MDWNASLGLVDLQTTTTEFTGVAPNFPAASLFTEDTDVRVSFSLLAASAEVVTYSAPLDLGNIAQTGLSQTDIDAKFFSGVSAATPASFTWSGGAGTPNNVGRVVSTQPVPEPSTIVTLAGGGLAVLTYAGRRTLRRRRRTKAC